MKSAWILGFFVKFYAANNKKKRQQSHLFFKVNYQLSSWIFCQDSDLDVDHYIVM